MWKIYEKKNLLPYFMNQYSKVKVHLFFDLEVAVHHASAADEWFKNSSSHLAKISVVYVGWLPCPGPLLWVCAKAHCQSGKVLGQWFALILMPKSGEVMPSLKVSNQWQLKRMSNPTCSVLERPPCPRIFTHHQRQGSKTKKKKKCSSLIK